MSIHLPQFDGGMVALAAGCPGDRAVLTYHCDLRLPARARQPRGRRRDVRDELGCRAVAHDIVAYTDDYAEHSSLLRRFPRKITVMPPPVVMRRARPRPCCRIAAHVGCQRRPGHRFGGATRHREGRRVPGRGDASGHRTPARSPGACSPAAFETSSASSTIASRCNQTSSARRSLELSWACWNNPTMADFFGAIDVLVVSSINSTESFGLVQVEAMLCGTPVVATALPGVRQPVMMTGMGKVVPVADAACARRGDRRRGRTSRVVRQTTPRDRGDVRPSGHGRRVRTTLCRSRTRCCSRARDRSVNS